MLFLAGCGKENTNGSEAFSTESGKSGDTEDSGRDTLSAEAHVENAYAEEFEIIRYKDGYRQINIGDQEILVVPAGKNVLEDVPEETMILKQPVGKIYMASSSAMSFFVSLDQLRTVEFTSTKASDWADETVRNLVKDDTITYVGKYNTPDYDWLLTEGAGLAIENTMILHSPETKEKLEQLGIPVIIERSSYEKNPMGRMEWVKVYGCILGCEEQAKEWFDARDAEFKALTENRTSTGKKVAYFSFSPNGYVNVQKPKGYFAELIRLAGGESVFTAENLSVDENDSSSAKISREDFYNIAKDADILIYNGAITGSMDSVSEMLEQEPLMKDFKAVQSGQVYTTKDNLFQEPTKVTELLGELVDIIYEKPGEAKFIIRIE
jgi:iron complex transport system substrate-binding protein